MLTWICLLFPSAACYPLGFISAYEDQAGKVLEIPERSCWGTELFSLFPGGVSATLSLELEPWIHACVRSFCAAEMSPASTPMGSCAAPPRAGPAQG